MTTCINNNININDFIYYVNIDISDLSMDMVDIIYYYKHGKYFRKSRRK